MEETISEKLDRAIQVAEGIIPALTVHSDMQKAAQAVLNLTQAKAQYRALSEPTEQLNEGLSFVLGRVRSNLPATELQQTTQAVMHLTAAKALAEGADQPMKRGPGRPRKPEVTTD